MLPNHQHNKRQILSLSDNNTQSRCHPSSMQLGLLVNKVYYKLYYQCRGWFSQCNSVHVVMCNISYTHFFLLLSLPVGPIHPVVKPTGIAEVVTFRVPPPKWSIARPTIIALARNSRIIRVNCSVREREKKIIYD